MQHVWDTLVAGTQNFVHTAGFSKVVLGLSGGIDSAVVACLARQALGAQSVLAVLMPSPYSSHGSVTDSLALALDWGFETIEIPIRPLMTAFDHALEPVFGDRDPNVTEENIQARVRAVLLMALSNEQDRLLLNTSNKSEDYVGYCTLYGDSCGAIAPIGDLYKTEVYELARWINSESALPNIPVDILNKAPSAELSEGQLDTNDLPPYGVLDPILRLHIDCGKSLEEIVAAGHDRTTVTPVLRLVRSSAFKRQQSPPMINVKVDERGP